jgi:hypothetical protein
MSVAAGTCLPSCYPEMSCIILFIKNSLPQQRPSFRDRYPVTGLNATQYTGNVPPVCAINKGNIYYIWAYWNIIFTPKFVVSYLSRQVKQAMWCHFALVTNQHHGAEPALRSRQLCSYLRISQEIMEPESSLPCSQESWSLTWARSIQSIPPHLSSLTSILILTSHLRPSLPSDLFPSGFHTKIIHAFLFSPFVLRALPISFSFTSSL